MEEPNFILEFIEEAVELNDRFSKVCQELSRGGDTKKLVDEAFRIVHTIKGSGASVGCSNLAEGLHLLENQLDRLRSQKELTVAAEFIDQLAEWDSAIAKCLEGLRHNPRHPLNLPVIANHITLVPKHPLQTAIHRQTAALSPPSATYGENGLPGPPLEQDAEVTSPLHFRSFFLSRNHISEDLAWSYVALSQLAMVHQRQNFAEQALEILRNQCQMDEIDRVCLVRRVGLSSQFVALSSATSDTQNPMPAGYSCFVDLSGSIFNIPRGSIRTIDVNKIIDNYKRQNRPPQKSMQRLHQFGYQSGAMIPIHNRGRQVGLLFLNSKTTKLHDSRKNWYPLLAMLTLYASVLLQEGPLLNEDYFYLVSENIDILGIGPFSITKLQSSYDWFTAHLQGLRVRFEVTEDIPPTILAHGHVAYLLASVYSNQKDWTPTVKIFPKNDCVYFDCQLPIGFSENKQAHLAKIWKDKALALGMNTLLNDWILCFTLPMEHQSYQDICYSVE